MRKGLVIGALFAIFSTGKPGLEDLSLISKAALASDLSAAVDRQVVPSAGAALGTAPKTTQTFQLRKGRYLGKFKVTFYWMVEEEAYEGKKTTPLYTANGQKVGMFTPEFVRDFRTESCALLKDGRVISYLKRSNRCTVVDVPIGTGGHTLQELKSVAVDPDVIPLGSTIYIPEADDVPLGNSRFHDGVFKAHDIGGLIKGDRIDVYLGLRSNMDFFRSTPLCRPGYVDVYLLQ
ncbi:MAG: 3D domain-containing protein [candidate division WOR-3 bacterium]